IRELAWQRSADHGNPEKPGQEQEVEAACRRRRGQSRRDTPQGVGAAQASPGGVTSSRMARRATSRTVVLGVDGAASAGRAARFLARLAPGPRGRVTVVRVLEPTRPPSMPLMPRSARELIAEELGRLQRAAHRRAQRSLDAASALLTRAGWRVQT